MLKLTAMQVDALTEIVNIGVGRAASSLSDIIGAHILLKVPAVNIFPLSKLPDILSSFHNGKLVSVLQGFQGDFSGTSALVFPPESALRLVTALTGNDSLSPTMDAVRSGTLVEVGNIIINAILGTMGNMLESNFIFSLPEYREIKNLADAIGLDPKSIKEGLILLAEANFNISSLEINGYIFILFKLQSITNLVDMINHSIKTSSAT